MTAFHHYISNPIYAGIVVTKWTNYEPVKTPYDSLVSIETWNKTNR